MLELGKYYQQRDGLVVGPLEAHESSSIGFENFSFKASGVLNSSFASRTWKANGKFDIYDTEHAHDLVSEVQFVPLTEQPKEEIMSKPLKLEVGKYYEDRYGDVLGPIVENKYSSDYPFICEGGTFTGAGAYCIGEASDYDLIKQVPNPNQESEPMPDQPTQPEATLKFKEISLTEALEVLKNEGKVFATFGNIDGHFEFDSDSSISHLLSATRFEIEIKPVVKYLVVYGDGWNTYITPNHFESIKAFYNDFDVSVYHQAELIQFTRKEF
jgi:hypothetical protein